MHTREETVRDMTREERLVDNAECWHAQSGFVIADGPTFQPLSSIPKAKGISLDPSRPTHRLRGVNL